MLSQAKGVVPGMLASACSWSGFPLSADFQTWCFYCAGMLHSSSLLGKSCLRNACMGGVCAPAYADHGRKLCPPFAALHPLSLYRGHVRLGRRGS